MRTLLRARLLIVGTGVPPIEDAAMLIGADGRIEWVGTSAAAPRPEAARVVELGPATLLPGLIDSHVHLSFDAGPDHAAVRAVLESEEPYGLLPARALRNAQMALLSGVTTVRDCGAKGLVALRVRDAIADGLATGPRVVACGMPITTTGGHLHYCGLRADSESDVRRSVRWLAQAGADAIKIVSSGGNMTAGSNPLLPQYPAGVLAAAAEEAHRLGRRIVAHALNARSIRDCFEAGIDTIDHATWSLDDGSVGFDAALGARLARSDTTLGLTGSGILRQLLTDTAGVQELRERLRPHRELLALGARVVVHSDAGVRFTPFDQFILSLQVMEVGLDAARMQVLQSATAHAAAALGLADEVGTLEVGKRADVVCVESNPLEDLNYLRQVRRVWRDGRVVVEDGRLAAPAVDDAR
jgi:imidazolonepropionase-like amidohydrolase